MQRILNRVRCTGSSGKERDKEKAQSLQHLRSKLSSRSKEEQKEIGKVFSAVMQAAEVVYSMLHTRRREKIIYFRVNKWRNRP